MLQETISKRDWEQMHELHDAILLNRLYELDPEFVKHLTEVTDGATFWFS